MVDVLGKPVKRVEDPRLITGSDPYVNDFKLAGAVYLAFVRSPHAHAVLKSIDTKLKLDKPKQGGKPSESKPKD